ncbi:MAG: hypothetical protein PHG27_12330 [Massilibacteroides sp.]|nr:hypothetical protein [Massilibacteroides sp.]
MVQKIKLIQRYTKPGDITSEKKWYATTISNGVASLAEVCTLIAARSTVSSADVKAVMDNLNFVADFLLKSGYSVKLGELGMLRISVSSKGVKEKEEFSINLLKEAKIVFTPGSILQETRGKISFDLPSEKEEEKEDSGAETPGEI